MPVYKERGLWSFSISINGIKYHRRGFTSSKEAKEAEADFIISNPKGKIGRQITVSELARDFLNQQKHNIKQTSIYDLERILSKHIEPIFGNLQIDKITPLMINNWRRKLLDSNYSFVYVNKIFRYFKSLYNYSCIYHNLKDNPFLRVEATKRKVPKKEKPFYTKEQFNKLYEALPDKLVYRTMFRIFFFMGLRLGELQALQWEDIDFDNKEMSINKTYSRFKNGKDKLGKTKTSSSNAKLTIPDAIIAMLINLKAEEKKQYKEVSNNDFIFGVDQPIPERTIQRTAYKAMAKVGLPKITIHGLRHSCGSYYLASGVPIEVVSKILRHSSIGITMQVYLHVSESRVSNVLSNIKID